MPKINKPITKRITSLSSDDVLLISEYLQSNDIKKINKIIGLNIKGDELKRIKESIIDSASEVIELNNEALREYKRVSILSAKKDSMSYDEFTEVEKASGDFSQQYNYTIYRTTGASEIQEGLNDLMKNDDFKSLYPNMKYIAQDDAFTREDHQAWDGVIVSGDDEILGEMATPLHYNCRCVWIPTDEEPTHGDGLEAFPPIPENKF